MMRNKKEKWRDEGYLLPSDIENIIADFTPIEKQIREQEGNVSESYINLLCDLVEETIHTRICDVSWQHKTEKSKEQATVAAREYAQTPRYYRPFRRLFRLTPNRAMQLIIEHEAQAARLVHMQEQIENDDLKSRADNMEDSYYTGETNSEDVLNLMELMQDVLPHPRGKRARAMQNQAIERLALHINSEIERRLKEQSESFGDTGGNDVPEQWLNDVDEISDESDIQPAEPAQKAHQTTQSETLVKPKRKRRRKAETENKDNEEQIEGQMAIEELGNATEKSPELA